MNKYLFLADIHAHNYKRHSTLIDGKNSRMMNILDAIREAFEIGIKNDCKACFIAGDIFHVRGKMIVSVFNDMFYLFAELAQQMPIYIIPGNHDQVTLSGDETSINTLNLLSGVKVFLSPALEVLSDGTKVALIPYLNDTNELEGVIKSLSINKPDIYITHVGVDDVRPTENIPLSGINVSLLSELCGDTLFVAGHYHRAKTIKSENLVFLSPGAIIQHDFGDEGDERGCWVGNKNSLEFFKVAYPEFKTFLVLADCKAYFRGVARIRTNSIKKAERIKRALPRALSFQVELEKRYSSTYSTHIKISSPFSMVAEYISQSNSYKDKSKELLDLFERICL